VELLGGKRSVRFLGGGGKKKNRKKKGKQLGENPTAPARAPKKEKGAQEKKGVESGTFKLLQRGNLTPRRGELKRGLLGGKHSSGLSWK